MKVYYIVLLPTIKEKNLLNDLKNDLYIGGYRYTNKPSFSDVHITLNQIKVDDTKKINKLKIKLQKILTIYKPFKQGYFKITEEIKDGKNNEKLKEKYPNGRGRVSLLFKNNNILGEITKKSIEIARNMQINDIDSYISNIKNFKPKNERTNNILDYTANHLNICNYCLPEKANKIKNIVKDKIPNEILFDTIALRDENGKHIFEIQF